MSPGLGWPPGDWRGLQGLDGATDSAENRAVAAEVARHRSFRLNLDAGSIPAASAIRSQFLEETRPLTYQFGLFTKRACSLIVAASRERPRRRWRCRSMTASPSAMPRRSKSFRFAVFSKRDGVGCEASASPALGSRPTIRLWIGSSASRPAPAASHIRSADAHDELGVDEQRVVLRQRVRLSKSHPSGPRPG